MASAVTSVVPQKLFYTRAEFAELIGVSISTVINFERRGQISCVRFGESVRIPRRELVRFIGRENLQDIE